MSLSENFVQNLGEIRDINASVIMTISTIIFEMTKSGSLSPNQNQNQNQNHIE